MQTRCGRRQLLRPRRWVAGIALLSLLFFTACQQDLPGTTEKLRVWSGAETYIKASQVLTGSYPSADRIATVQEGGLYALNAEVQALMETEAFYAWIEGVYADVLRTRQYAEQYAGYKNKLLPFHNVTSYPAGDYVRYPANYPNEWVFIEYALGSAFVDHAIDNAGDYLAEEPLKLISYVVRNNLPFSDILSADYTVLNPHAAFLYGLDVVSEFGADYNDATYWKPVQVRRHLRYNSTGIPSHWVLEENGLVPHAGVLTTTAFLARYPDSAVNRNRTRAHTFLRAFLNFDVLRDLSLVQDVSSEDLSNPDAVNSGVCAGCHTYLDRVAQGWYNFGPNLYVRPSAEGFPVDTTMQTPGLFLGAWPPANTPASRSASRLRWLGETAATAAHQRRSFAHAVTFTFFDALTGGNAREEIKDNLGLKFFLDDQAEAFRGTGSTPTYDVKALIRGLVFSEYFRASRVQGQSLAQTKYRNHGTARLLPPELLARKIRENFDDVIRANRLNAIASELEKPSALGLAYGGTRYTDESDRNSEMNPFMANIQLKVAADLACAIVKEEFSKPQSERKIFKEVELDTEFTSPEDPNLVNMALAVGRVYERMSVPWGFFAIGPAQVIWLETEEAVSIFDVPGACRPNTGVSRKNTLKWMAVLTYALADYYVFHQ